MEQLKIFTGRNLRLYLRDQGAVCFSLLSMIIVMVLMALFLGDSQAKAITDYYFESVDHKVFAYCQNQVYEIHKKLYELEADYAGQDFLRISKSTIVHLPKILHLKPLFNGRFEAALKNREKVIISRQYVATLKKKLGI